MTEHTSSHLINTFISLSLTLTTQSHLITSLLNSLISNSTRRIECVYSLERLRAERDEVLQMENTVIARERELLSQVERELDTFERERRRRRRSGVALEEEEDDAEGAGSRARRRSIDSSGPPIAALPASEEVSPEATTTDDRPERPRRLSMSDTRPLSPNSSLSLPHPSSSSSSSSTSSRLSSLLTSITHSRSLSTTHTRTSLSRLSSLTSSTSRILTQLSLERNILSKELGAVERGRMKGEDRLAEVVLELVLCWDAGRKGEREGREEREDREEEEVLSMWEKELEECSKLERSVASVFE